MGEALQVTVDDVETVDAHCLSTPSLPTPNELSGSVKVEAITPGADCLWLHGALSLAEQARLFEFVKSHDRTDWENLPVCMNPAPTTLQLEQPGGGRDTAPTLVYDRQCGDDAVASVATEAVDGVRGMLRGRSLTLAGGPLTEPTSISLAAIRYQSPGGRFPPHIDHCNDGSWVFLFTLGCSARFHVKAPAMDSPRELQLQSGDALVFDPSSGAGILHGVAGIGEEVTCPSALGERFAELRSFRYGLQCRVRY
uniref:Fe2OG dioxygenase domain-containing protein n=1 Tax=Haptolina brevifila TaxID=156173 RepID=A0A7S2IAK0_9EUKA|mmetsp:Transcript_63597/g.125782  ORF Transcript_63597/g.125782 Transcript_63597/m.125782 type:complete len:253 (+) Transcript_63597:568-1326(+)